MKKLTPKDLIIAEDARALLGVSSVKMSRLIKDGALPYYENPLDKRVKLLSRADVLALREPRAKEAA